MAAYILRRLLLIIPTLFGIMVINFAIVQVAPGGPVEQMIAQITGTDAGSTARLGGGTGGDMGSAARQTDVAGQGAGSDVKYRGAQGLDPALIARIEKQFGFDKPAHERFFIMVRDYATFNFGESFFKGRPVIDLILDKLPVSITLGLWTTLIVYMVSIPLGIRKAVRDGTRFDTWTSAAIIVGYAIPGFLFAVLLIVLFAGGSYWDIFPLRGLTSDNWDQLSWFGKTLDYLWHICLPVLAMTIGGFASLTMLTKNSFLDEINKQYVMTARAKGLTEHRVLYGHVFRNAMLIVIAGFPGLFVSILFANSLLIEYIFSLDGLGLLTFEALIQRDYPIMFGSLYVFTLIGLIVKLIGDLTYVWVDPRIDFATRDVG
ncbi:microcin C ABC transporter permease YejB [Emcibacter sp. SYSU 3D8]|uniref:microcin C ABC transporter permease YejB n=1 Tax=Emcibacter sp. SYSU 3D8 TaxID=3133969 RepID=UPI0031FE7947